jgi:hyperosmotically inducible protein
MSVATYPDIVMLHARILLLVLLISTQLSGCIAVVAGGAAAGGYILGTDERTVGQITDDAAITGGIKTRLLGAHDIKALDINVDTYLQVVTLRGQVYSAKQKDAAVKIAQEYKGVKQVIPELSINSVKVENR